ncbi:MAG TPA: DUF3093 domain-containing protein [Propionicimonas sp.]|nr:DUF3093 domain-containing protein [Propionicimonas sp.]HRA06531.1 DUF3093 domain-containing protein [Propionicimonas sp.]
MDYEERLSVPAVWWLIGLFFALSFVTAVGFYAGPWVAVVAGAITAVAVAGVLLWFGRTRVAVDAGGLHAGPALLEWPYVGDVSVLSRAATRQRLGVGADHAAWLLVRGYVAESVEVAVADPDDPHPYWLVSSRRPEKLAAALAARAPISPDEDPAGRS